MSTPEIATERTGQQPTAWVALQCRECSTVLKVSRTMVPDAVVHVCHHCRSAKLEGDTQVFRGDGLVAQLTRRANELDEQRRYDEMRDSDINDPRWTQLS